MEPHKPLLYRIAFKGKEYSLAHPLLSILSIALLLRLSYLLLQPALWWDTHIYFGMAKYLFSGGSVGIWEIFRAPLHPLLLGVFWKLGLPLLAVGKAWDVLLGLGLVAITYKIAMKGYSKPVAGIAALIVATIPMLLRFTGIVLSELLAIMLALAGLAFFLYKKNIPGLVLSGILLGLSFLTRFPQGLFFAGVLVTLFFMQGQMKKKLQQIFLVGAGFLLPVIPYLWWNTQKYGNIWEPFTSGSAIITTGTWLYGSGFTFYLTHVFLAYPLFLAALAYGYYWIKEQGYRHQEKLLIVSIVALFIAYFLYVPRKEVRYLAPIIPLLAIMSSVMLVRWHEHLKKQEKPFLQPKGMVVIVVLCLLLPLLAVRFVDHAPPFEKEVVEIIAGYQHPIKILSSHPFPITYFDYPLTLFGGMDFALQVYEMERGKYQLLFLSDCDLPCAPGDRGCQEKRGQLFQQIARENREISHKTFEYRTTSQRCEYWIYLAK